MISVAVLASRLLAVVREALFAAIFGTQKFADVFVLAFRIPNLLRDLFAEGTMTSAFVPTFTATLTDKGRDRAYDLANLLATGLLLITSAITLIGILFADAIVDAMAPGFAADPEKRRLAITASQIMMPFLPLVSLAAVAMGILNAQRRFFLPALAPAMFNVASIVVGVFLYMTGYRHEPAVLGWSVGALIAAVVQLVVQLPMLRRLGWRFRPAIRTFFADPGIRRMAALMGPAVIGLAAVQINVVVNSIFASNLGNGPMAQLNYAWRLFYLPLGLFGVAIATVTTTNVAEEAARRDYRALLDRVAHALKLTWMLTVPSAVGLIAVSIPTIRVLYQRGAFGAEDTLATAQVLIAYMIGLAPYSSVKMIGPAFYALDRPRIPMVSSMAAVAFNIAFNALTYRRLGAVGLAAGTTLAALVNVVTLTLALRWLLGPMTGQRLWSAAAKILVASAITGLIAWASWSFLETRLPVNVGAMARTAPARLAALFVPLVLGGFAYVAACRLLRLAEIHELIDPLLRRLRRML